MLGQPIACERRYECKQLDGVEGRAIRDLHLIHCGSSVTVSPGVTTAALESLSRFEGRPISGMSRSMSPSVWTAGEVGGVGEETGRSYEDREEGNRGKMAKTMAIGDDGRWLTNNE